MAVMLWVQYKKVVEVFIYLKRPQDANDSLSCGSEFEVSKLFIIESIVNKEISEAWRRENNSDVSNSRGKYDCGERVGSI